MLTAQLKCASRAGIAAFKCVRFANTRQVAQSRFLIAGDQQKVTVKEKAAHLICDVPPLTEHWNNNLVELFMRPANGTVTPDTHTQFGHGSHGRRQSSRAPSSASWNVEA